MEYEVVISFAGEDRKYAEELANCLNKMGLKVFYDKWYQAHLLGEDLTKVFQTIYSEEAPFCVSIISKAYRDKPWTKYEMRYIRDRQFSDDKYWLPIIREDVEIPGLRMTDGKVYEKDYDLFQIAEMICQKVFKWRYENNMQGDSEIMCIINEKGVREWVEIIIAFRFKDNKKEYIVYTKEEKDEKNNTTAYVSGVEHTQDGVIFNGINDEKEWKRIKKVLLEISKDSDESDNNDYDLEMVKYDEDGIEILGKEDDDDYEIEILGDEDNNNNDNK